jgi:3-oxoacyl-[acyl-carrier protein] reductase
MAKLKHALTGAEYELRPDGRVEVDEKGVVGVFESDGRWHSGALKSADPHLIGWLVSGETAAAAIAAAKPAPPQRRTSPAVSETTGANHRTGESRREKGMDLGLSGMKALVTAASRGIGLSIAQTFADEGADVAICARSAPGLEEAKKDLEARGTKVFTATADVGDEESIKGFVQQAGEALGGLDIAVCNASGGGGMGSAAWQANIDIDLLGSARTVEAAVPMLAESEAGAVVFISSTAALEFLGMPQPYNAVKAAIIAHASDLSQSLAPRGIRVNTVSPGPIYFEGGNWEMIKQAMPKIYEQALANCAIGRMGAPEEVARAVVFLASPAASLITGANLVADGGFTKRVAF